MFLFPVDDDEHAVAADPERVRLQGDHGRAAEGGRRRQQVPPHRRPLALPSPNLGVVAHHCRELQETPEVRETLA